MASQFQPVSTPTLRSQIAERLRHAILSTSLRQGEKIVERKLATQFATSLTAVREALIELESEGLVTKKPNAATYVTRLTKHSAEEIFAVRRLLEPAAVARAAELAKPADIEILERSYLDLLDAARAGNTERFIQTDFAFHRKIWQMAENECLQNTLRRLLLPIFGAGAIRIAASRPFDLTQDVQLHLPLLEAIRRRDPEGAKRALESAMNVWLDQVCSQVHPRHEDHKD